MSWYKLVLFLGVKGEKVLIWEKMDEGYQKTFEQYQKTQKLVEEHQKNLGLLKFS